MDPHGDKDRETLLLERANRRFGVLTWDELLEEGLTPTVIARRTKNRRLNRLHHGVYALGHTALQDKGRWLAALHAVDAGAALSHATAAAYFGWSVEEPDAPVHVSTTRNLRSRPGIEVHRVRHLDRVDVHRPHPFRVTAIPRTLVDLADVLPWPAYRALADGQRSLRVDKIREAQARTPKRPGAPLVTRLIEADDAHTKSEFERRFLAFLRDRGLPRPDALNVHVAGHRADCVYQQPRLVVELDGRAFHRRRAQMRADRRRDSDYQLAGHRILRLVWDDLHPDEVSLTAERVRRMLALS